MSPRSFLPQPTRAHIPGPSAEAGAVLLWVLLIAVQARCSAAGEFDFFEQRIRPALVQECYECHGAQKQKGGLRLDHREALRKGGESGPAIVPGDAAASRLLQKLQHSNPESRMPKDRPQLAGQVLADFATWINQGAPDPRLHPPTEGSAQPSAWAETLKARLDWWSFKPVKPVPPPAGTVTNGGWSKHPVDRFLLSRMVEGGLQPAPPADRDALLRRLTFALTGLPPSPEELEAFLQDTSPQAYERRVDALLASPRFGERWARHWMDLVRYSESHGSQGDPELPMAWRYRDYLIRAFNTDVPYNQFVAEQIAGDLLSTPRLNLVEGLNESALGTAHLRMVELGYIPVDALDDQVKVVDNQIDVVSKAFLGLTVSCARCHDHKFDPISQRDFYALYGVFASSRPGQILVDAPSLLATNRTELSELNQQIRSTLAQAWTVAADGLGQELQRQAQLSAARQQLDVEVQRLSRELVQVEARARAELTQIPGTNSLTSARMPLAQWSFEEDLRDIIGSMHGQAEGHAMVRGGRLVLDGTNSWVVTAPLPVSLKEKTLEVWLTLAGLAQKGGGALTVQTADSEVFDSIVLGERETAHWIAGSDYFRRTRDVGGPAETAKPDELVHLAIVYRADNSIALYRNGAPYGSNYQQGSLRTFTAGSARVVLGKRHLGSAVTGLAGEIEEARLYSQALTAEEISASFRAGVRRVDPAVLTQALTPKEREERARLQQELRRQEAERANLTDPSPAAAAWRAALTDAAANTANPLHPWVKLASLHGREFSDGWRQLGSEWRKESRARAEFNRTNFIPAWDLRGDEARRWFKTGAQPAEATEPGEFCVEVKGDRVLRGLYPAGIFTHALTRKQSGVLTSPRFQVTTDSISVRGLGERSMVRLVVENYAIGGGGLYPASGLGADEMKWLRLDTAYRKGAHAYLEFITADDSPISGSAEEGRAYFGAAEVVFHNGSQTPRDLTTPAAFVFSGHPPDSPAQLAERYGQRLTQAVAHWQTRRLSDEELRFLDYFVRLDLLPSSLTRLPQLKETVETFRKREAEIPVPRRAPGVHEAAAFDQPLFVRGSITNPGEPIPRRFLEMFGSRPFSTQLSGRLELAQALASPTNPLTARVLVNRLWHHLFGRGLVGTVDNFGRLGDKPTHPELLDYLAAHFVQHGWSMKQTIRLLVTSEAFQQSAVASPEARQVDPANELLSHARVRRLDAEAIRDAVLAVSGQLNLKMYGPGVNVYYVGKTEGGGAKGPLDGDRRRSVYQRIRRNASNPFLEVFDSPKPMSTRGKRDSTNVPAQSLTLLNDPFIIDQSAKWAKALVAEGRNPDERVRSMFVRAFGRHAAMEDLDAAREFLASLARDHKVAPPELQKSERVWQDFAQSLFCLKEFIYVE